MLASNVLLIFFTLRHSVDTTVIVSYPNLEEDFLEFLSEFNAGNRPTPTFSNATSSSLHNYCVTIRTAKFFNMSANTRLPVRFFTFNRVTVSLATSPRSSERHTLRLEDLTVHIGQESRTLRFLRCLIDEKMGQYWYATYGFYDSYLYVFKTKAISSEDHPRFELLGMAEPASTATSRIFRGMRHVERYFYNAYRAQEAVLPVSDVLCSLNANQQYRLCAVAHDVQKETGEREFYYTPMYNHTCLEQKIIRNREYDDEEDRKKYLTPHILANLVECTFTENQTESKFFLTSDPADEFAVFILLEDNRLPSTNDDKFVVIGHISNVTVLRYATNIY